MLNYVLTYLLSYLLAVYYDILLKTPKMYESAKKIINMHTKHSKFQHAETARVQNRTTADVGP